MYCLIILIGVHGITIPSLFTATRDHVFSLQQSKKGSRLEATTTSTLFHFSANYSVPDVFGRHSLLAPCTISKAGWLDGKLRLGWRSDAPAFEVLRQRAQPRWSGYILPSSLLSFLLGSALNSVEHYHKYITWEQIRFNLAQQNPPLFHLSNTFFFILHREHVVRSFLFCVLRPLFCTTYAYSCMTVARVGRLV